MLNWSDLWERLVNLLSQMTDGDDIRRRSAQSINRDKRLDLVIHAVKMDMWIEETYHTRIPPVFQPQIETREKSFWKQEIWVLIRGVRVPEFESFSLLEWRA